MIRMCLRSTTILKLNSFRSLTGRKKPDSQKAERVSPQMEREEDVTIFQQRPNKVRSPVPGCARGRSNHKYSPDSAPVNKASPPSESNHQSLFSLPVGNPVSWFSVMPTDLVRQILLPVSEACCQSLLCFTSYPQAGKRDPITWSVIHTLQGEMRSTNWVSACLTDSQFNNETRGWWMMREK